MTDWPKDMKGHLVLQGGINAAVQFLLLRGQAEAGLQLRPRMCSELFPLDYPALLPPLLTALP